MATGRNRTNNGEFSACSMIACCGLLFLGGLLTVILVPMSFKYIEYYQYGLKQSFTGEVDTTHVYTNGRYSIGMLNKFIHYPADAQLLNLRDLVVFSAGNNETSSVGLEFVVNVDLTYLLEKEQIGNLHKDLAFSYQNVLLSRTKDAIKNEAIYVTFEEYFQNRTLVEERFRRAVQTRWNSSPALPCILDQFYLGRIVIPQSVADRQLDARLQNERNGREENLQQAQVEREITSVLVNQIDLERVTTLRTAQAEANLIKSNAIAEANEIVLGAETNSTKQMVDLLGFNNSQANIISQQYIRALSSSTSPDKKVEFDLSYYPAENIVKTQNV